MPSFALACRCRSRRSVALWGLAAALALAGVQWLWSFSPGLREVQAGVLALAEAEVLASSSATPPDEGANWQPVSLPHRWTQTRGPLPDTRWYRLKVPVSDLPRQSWAVYLPRASMNAEVWLNGVSLGYSGSMDTPVTRNWYTPLLFRVPSSVWKAGDNTVLIRVRGNYFVQSGLGLSRVWVGPSQALSQLYSSRWWVQVLGVHAANVGLGMLGAFLVVLWLRDRSQVAFGFVGQAAILWGVGVSATIVPEAFLNLYVWDIVTFAALVWSQLSLTLFFLRFAERRWLWFERFIAGFALLFPAVFSLAPTQALVGLTYAMMYGIAMVGFLAAMWHAYRVRLPDRNLFAFGSMVTVPPAVHDVLLQLNHLPFDAVYILPYTVVVQVTCMAFIVAGDYARSRRTLDTLNQELADRVERREAELRLSFQRVAALEQAQAVSAERSRILRDMHDGVGAHLTTALRQLSPITQQPVDLPLVTRTLRESLDQLKLSIDAMSMPHGDVVGLLASLRFRMTPRLKAAGLHLNWDVDDLPDWPGGTQAALRQLQYILFEALSNVLQHAGAKEITLRARNLGDHLLLVLHDDGRGVAGSSEGPHGHGLQIMRGRAGAIGAGIEFFSPDEGGHDVRLTLPMKVQDE
ncbi:MAG: hypothetical protein KGL90_10925 [Burkholderiales bacterium]|nr:hypothetical protein [Burkholderiales bacterium]